MKRAVFLFERLAQPGQIGLVILFAKEAGFAVVPALRDVQRYATKMNARATEPVITLAEISEPGPFDFL